MFLVLAEWISCWVWQVWLWLAWCRVTLGLILNVTGLVLDSMLGMVGVVLDLVLDVTALVLNLMCAAVLVLNLVLDMASLVQSAGGFGVKYG